MINLIQSFLHIDIYLASLMSVYGIWLYVILFLIIFCETGLVIFPFLPGDSLLFAAGSLSAQYHQDFDFKLIFILLLTASIIGNKVNYSIGYKLGPRILFNQSHFDRAHQFYERHGGKAIILGRFMPIIRTFVPFVAGAAKMRMSTFAFYNITGALLWIGSLLSAGYFFGTLPFVKQHFSLIVYGIVIISLLPAIVSLVYRKRPDHA
jgi:membrane-associated protein